MWRGERETLVRPTLPAALGSGVPASLRTLLASRVVPVRRRSAWCAAGSLRLRRGGSERGRSPTG